MHTVDLAHTGDLAHSCDPTQVIVPMASYDIYKNIHKGVRAELFAVTVEAGNVDPDDHTAVAGFVARFRALVDLLTHHAAHEDRHLEPVISEVMGGHAREISESHVVLEDRLVGIGHIVDAAAASEGIRRRAGLHMAYLELAAFTADYLQHQDDEERVVMPALDAALPTETLVLLDAQIVASIAPDVMAACLTVMLPAMNLPDRVELLVDIRDHAPAEVFAGVWGLAGQILAPRAYLETAHRLGLAVDGNAFAGADR